ncbi:MAG TPA: DUF4870 domain-containing protein [Thermoanaerobaculia bacterium]|nr:DUF4870 domain-containing protein [Thermoanaerobaculia bacterium]
MSDIPSYTPPPPPPPGGSYTPPPPPPPGGPAASSDRTIMLVLSYLGILALIPLLVKKDDKEVQWHAKNGLGLTVAWILLWIVIAIIERFMPGVVSCGIAVIHCVLALGFLAVIVLAIMKALKGERMRFPVISDFADKN